MVFQEQTTLCESFKQTIFAKYTWLLLLDSAKNGVQGGAPLPEMEGERIPLGGETDSLDDDGVDPERFNEDGSFIGQYGDTKPAPNSHMV